MLDPFFLHLEIPAGVDSTIPVIVGNAEVNQMGIPQLVAVLEKSCCVLCWPRYQYSTFLFSRDEDDIIAVWE